MKKLYKNIFTLVSAAGLLLLIAAMCACGTGDDSKNKSIISTPPQISEAPYTPSPVPTPDTPGTGASPAHGSASYKPSDEAPSETPESPEAPSEDPGETSEAPKTAPTEPTLPATPKPPLFSEPAFTRFPVIRTPEYIIPPQPTVSFSVKSHSAEPDSSDHANSNEDHTDKSPAANTPSPASPTKAPARATALLPKQSEGHSLSTGQNTHPKDSSQKPSINKSFEDDVIELVNEERAKYGLTPLSSGNEALTKTAEIRAEECITSFSHTRPDGTSCFTAFQSSGLSYKNAGENIAYGFSLPQSVVNSWMNSPGHRANILSSNFTQIGVGCVYYKGVYYWAQSFIG